MFAALGSQWRFSPSPTRLLTLGSKVYYNHRTSQTDTPLTYQHFNIHYRQISQIVVMTAHLFRFRQSRRAKTIRLTWEVVSPSRRSKGLLKYIESLECRMRCRTSRYICNDRSQDLPNASLFPLWWEVEVNYEQRYRGKLHKLRCFGYEIIETQ